MPLQYNFQENELLLSVRVKEDGRNLLIIKNRQNRKPFSKQILDQKH